MQSVITHHQSIREAIRIVTVGALGGPRAGVDAMCCLCCDTVVGGQFAGCRPLVFHHSLLLLVRWVDAWE
jgi:hypothetical protein